MPVCPHCSEEYASGDRFCSGCGAVARLCPNGHGVREGDGYCSTCGSDMDQLSGAAALRAGPDPSATATAAPGDRRPAPPLTGWAPISAPVAYGSYAEWGGRVAGYLIDVAVGVAPLIGLYILSFIFAFIVPGLSLLLVIVAWLWPTVVSIWFAVQVGQTGQSPGMRIMGLKCVGGSTGQPIGGGLGFLRSVAHIADVVILYIGFLFPLWDPKRQTLADKIMDTVVITVPKLPFTLAPSRSPAAPGQPFLSSSGSQASPAAGPSTFMPPEG